MFRRSHTRKADLSPQGCEAVHIRLRSKGLQSDDAKFHSERNFTFFGRSRLFETGNPNPYNGSCHPNIEKDTCHAAFRRSYSPYELH